MKKWSSLIVMVIVGILLCGYSSQAEEVTNSGIIYRLDEEDNTCGVVGYNASYMSSNVSIPETITQSGKIYKVTWIGDYAFFECEKIESINLPKSIKEIAQAAFKECKKLKTISIQEGLEKIDIEAFYGCSSLEKIAIPSTTYLIELTSFKLCDNLKEIKVDEDNDDYFDLEGVLFGYGATYGREGRILCCYPGGKTGDTFKLESDMTCGGENPFINNHNLKSIVVDSNNESHFSQDGVLYRKFFSYSEDRYELYLCACPAGKTGKVSILDGVETILWGAFYGSYASEIIIPDSVTGASPDAFVGCSNLEKLSIGKGFDDVANALDFSSYKKLNSIVVSPENKTFTVMNGILYNKEGTKIIYCPKSVTSATVSSAVTAISENAFINCSDSLVLTVEKNSFMLEYAKSNGIKYIIKGQNVDEKVESNIVPKGTTINVSAQKCKVKVTSSSATAPTVSYIKSTNSKAKTITIPDTVKVDGITYKVTSVASSALANNKKVTKVTIGKNVTSIGKNAFKKCTKLKTVTLKSTSLKSIGSNAFYGDKNLKTITIKSSKLTSKSVGKNAFKGTNKKLTIKVPKKKVSSYKKFLKKKGNKKVTVKKG